MKKHLLKLLKSLKSLKLLYQKIDSKNNPLLYIDEKNHVVIWIYNNKKSKVFGNKDTMLNIVLSTIDKIVDCTGKKPVMYYI